MPLPVGKQHPGVQPPEPVPVPVPLPLPVPCPVSSIALALVLFVGCQPLHTPPEPLLVHCSDLVTAYRDSRDVANRAYTNTIVLIPVTGSSIHNRELWWHIGGHDRPPAIVFEFAENPVTDGKTVWIRGTCAGRYDDQQNRETPGVTFHIIVRDSSLASPPTSTKP